MPECDIRQHGVFSYKLLERPLVTSPFLRLVRAIVDEIRRVLPTELDAISASSSRPSVSSDCWSRASLLQVLHIIRGKPVLYEQPHSNLLLFFFVERSVDKQAFDQLPFLTNCKPVLEADFRVMSVTGRADYAMAVDLLTEVVGADPITAEADMAHDGCCFVEQLRDLNVNPHVARTEACADSLVLAPIPADMRVTRRVSASANASKDVLNLRPATDDASWLRRIRLPVRVEQDRLQPGAVM